MTLMGGGLLLYSLAGVDTGYWYVAICLVVMATGVGLAMPSLSAGIVQSVPLHKAGVGSAVNDTTREVGGAIGIAVIGSVITTVYRDRLGSTLDVLPDDLRDAARDNVGQAFFVTQRASEQLGAETAGQLRRAVQEAFVDGAHIGLRIAAALVVAAAVVVARRLRGVGDRAGGPLH
jgi:hypothetical protein